MEIKPIRTKRDYERTLREIERLWGAKDGTVQGDRLYVLATLVEGYERKHFAIDALPERKRLHDGKPGESSER